MWGDAAIGFTGMDFETAVRERIPILSILLNNFSMAIELHIMKVSTEKYRSTDISGDYAAMARAFGGYGERVTKPEDIIPAIKRGIEQTKKGEPVLLEFITSKEVTISVPNSTRPLDSGEDLSHCGRMTRSAHDEVLTRCRARRRRARRALDESSRCREGHRLDAQARRHVPRRCSACRCRPRRSSRTRSMSRPSGRSSAAPSSPSEQRDVWALGAPADERNAALEGLDAPDFTLPDVERRAAHAVAAQGQEGLSRHLGQLVRLPV